jgi:hypothetical protein|tara:strand:+ start:181 stop:570 length:390 start_codon:yes stop_codon:yes gene_type:complete
MNTQQVPDLLSVIVGPTSDELVADGYFTDVTPYAKKFHDMTDKVRITPNISIMLAQLGSSEAQEVEWYDELDSLLTTIRGGIMDMNDDDFKNFEKYRHTLMLKHKDNEVWLAMDCTSGDSVHIFTPAEY